MPPLLANANLSLIIAEAAKANNPKPYGYFEYLLTEIPKHLEEKDSRIAESYYNNVLLIGVAGFFL